MHNATFLLLRTVDCERQDISESNIVTWIPGFPSQFLQWYMSTGRIYLIDFGSSRQFHEGPGEGLMIYDWKTFPGTSRPPEGMDVVDPYAFDVYSFGDVMFDICEVSSGFARFISKLDEHKSDVSGTELREAFISRLA